MMNIQIILSESGEAEQCKRLLDTRFIPWLEKFSQHSRRHTNVVHKVVLDMLQTIWKRLLSYCAHHYFILPMNFHFHYYEGVLISP